jgi:hypothetical protein
MSDKETAAPTNSMLIAASILRENPHIIDDDKLLQDILSGLRKAILEERAACLAEAQGHFDVRTVNRPEYTVMEIAVKFTKKCVAANIIKGIEDRAAP